MLAEALAMVDKTEERWHEAEMYRIKGDAAPRLVTGFSSTGGRL